MEKLLNQPIKENKLISLYSLLTAWERKQFNEFVHSEFLNKHEKVKLLLGVLENATDLEALSKGEIHKVLYPGQSFHLQQLKDVMSYLTGLLEKYLAWQQFQNSDLEKQMLLKNLRERKAEKPFSLIMRSQLKQMGKRKIKDSDHFATLFAIANEADAFFIEQSNRRADNSLQQKADALDLFFFAQKLKIISEMLNRKKILKVDLKITLKDEIFGYLEEKKVEFSNYPAAFVYYRVIKLLENPDDVENYHAFKNYLSDHFASFAEQEARQLYQFAINYCVGRINRGEDDYMHRLFDLYKEMLDKRMAFTEKYLSPWYYKNIITVGLRLKENEWVENFIHKFKKHLAPRLRENSFNYNLAAYYYSNKRYEEAMRLLLTVEFTDIFYSLDSRAMLMRIYFDIEERDPLLSLAGSYSLYIRRNRFLAKEKAEGYLNFIRLTRRLFTIVSNKGYYSDKKFDRELDAFRKIFANTKNLVNKVWLQEKLDELIEN